MKICTTCGAQYDNEVEICSNDGTPLFAQFSATVEPAPVDESPVLSNPSLDDDAPPSLVEGLSAAFEDASASISEALLPGNPFEAEPEPLLHEEAPPLAVEPIDPAPFTAEPLEEESEDVAAAAAAFVEATKAPQKTPIPSFFPEESDENLGVKALEAAQAQIGRAHV